MAVSHSNKFRILWFIRSFFKKNLLLRNGHNAINYEAKFPITFSFFK